MIVQEVFLHLYGLVWIALKESGAFGIRVGNFFQWRGANVMTCVKLCDFLRLYTPQGDFQGHRITDRSFKGAGFCLNRTDNSIHFHVELLKYLTTFQLIRFMNR